MEKKQVKRTEKTGKISRARKSPDAPPTRVYKYGIGRLPSDPGPIIHQMKMSNWYRNLLVDIGIGHRKARLEALHGCPELAEQQTVVDALLKQQSDLKDEITAAKVAGRTRKIGSDQKERLKELGDKIGQAFKAFYAAIKKVEDPEILGKLKLVDERKKFLELAAREYATREWGLFWGSYLPVEESVKQAFQAGTPDFRRFNGEGRIGVQLQKDNGKQNRVFSDDATFLKIKPLETSPDELAKMGNSRRHRAQRTKLSMRIGSTEKKKPIWAHFDDLILHRALPDDAVIKWAFVSRKQRAETYYWQLDLFIESKTFVPLPRIGNRKVGFNLGWRKRGDRLRVAYFQDSNGHHEEILLPAVVRDLHVKADELMAIRDENYNNIKTMMFTWFKGAKAVPAKMREDAEHMSKWLAKSRMIKFAHEWRANRFEGDDAMFEVMWAWRRQERHLFDWESANRSRSRLHRREFYRLTAQRLARVYDEIIIDDADYARLARSRDGGAEAKFNRTVSASGEFREILKQAFAKAGSKVSVAAARNVTLTCHACKAECEWDHVKLRHTCEHCGAEWDQDRNAALNVLMRGPKDNASGPTDGASREPLESESDQAA